MKRITTKSERAKRNTNAAKKGAADQAKFADATQERLTLDREATALALATEMTAAAAQPRVAKVFNGTYTINSPKTGHRTISIKTQAEDATFAPNKRVVALLTGPENTDDANYRGFAFIDDNGINVWRSKRGTPTAPSTFDWLAKMLWSLATEGESSHYYTLGYRLLTEGRCIKCNRKLTHPTSIITGIGPECAGRSGN